MKLPDLRPHDRIDLHLHSDRSDGRYAPEEVLERCAASGLTTVALTDHDLAAEIDPGPHRLGERTLHVIAGAEVSGLHEGTEYHLLVYFPGEVPQGFRDFCAMQVRARARRYEVARERLALPGVPPADEAAFRGERALTRHHLARSLVEAGHAADLRDAFARYTGDAHGNVPSLCTGFTEAIRIARENGGLTSWAHPPPAAVKRHLETFVAAGLQGLEGLRPTLSGQHRRMFRNLAKRHGLYLTGGSDWHGWSGDELGLFWTQPQELRGFLDALRLAA